MTSHVDSAAICRAMAKAASSVCKATTHELFGVAKAMDVAAQNPGHDAEATSLGNQRRRRHERGGMGLTMNNRIGAEMA